MSETLRLSFADDMPPAYVEVVTPEYRTVAQVWLRPGESQEIEAPSTDAIVQVRMPSGETASLRDPAQRDLRISLASLVQRTPFGSKLERARETQGRAPSSAPAPTLAPGRVRLTTDPPAADGHLHVALTSDGTPEEAQRSPNGEGVLFTAFGVAEAYDATVTRGVGSGQATLRLRLPGSLTHLAASVRAEEAGTTLRLRAATRHDVADTLGAYLTRGDLHAASSMTGWIEQAEQMLYDKRRDPSAATVGAYLLLRLRRFDLMRTWTRNLATWWPELADGSIIWAWQLIHSRQDPDEAKASLLKAARCDALPVFTEGLRLLFDGLQLLGDDGAPLLKALTARTGTVVWTSPFTAYLPDGALAPRLGIDAGYMTERLPVESSALDVVGYDDTTNTLDITFDDGAVYEYYDVPPAVFDALIGADSKGTYFNENVKPAGFEYRRVR